MPIVEAYEKKRNGEAFAGAPCEKPTKIETEDDVKQTVAGVLNHFWPEMIYLAHKGCAADNLEDGFDLAGNPCKGVYHDPSQDDLPLPGGVVVNGVLRSRGVKRTREEDCSSKHIAEDQGKRLWKMLSSKHSQSLDVAETKGDKGESIFTKNIASAPGPEDDEDKLIAESSDSDFAVVKHPVSTQAKKSSGSQQPAHAVPEVKPAALAIHVSVRTNGDGKLGKRKRIKKDKVPKPQTPKKANSTTADFGQMPTLPAWHLKQKALRELQQCDKVLVPLDLWVSQFFETGSIVLPAEAIGLLSKVNQRLGASMRWVYSGDDLEACSDTDVDTQTLRRQSSLQRLLAGQLALESYIPILQANYAKPSENDAYDPANYKLVLEDAFHRGVIVPYVYPVLYAQRVSVEQATLAVAEVVRVWEAFHAQVILHWQILLSEQKNVSCVS